MYKLIALDMDGTVLKEDKTISKATLTAIKNAKNKGIKVVLATGRPLRGIEKYLQELNLTSKDDYAVTFNGAVVQNTSSGKILTEIPLDLEDVHILYDLSKDLNVNMHASTQLGCITPKNNKYSQFEAAINFISINEIDFETLDIDIPIIKVLFVEEPHKLDEAIKKIPSDFYDKYTIVKSAPYFLEFLNKSVNKGTGIELLAKNLGIRREEIICIGDAGNDIHMIKYAGLGVAMGNAFPEVKEAADYVTYSNEYDGVAHVIDKFILAS